MELFMNTAKSIKSHKNSYFDFVLSNKVYICTCLSNISYKMKVFALHQLHLHHHYVVIY